MTGNGPAAPDPVIGLIGSAYTDPRGSVRALLNMKPDERARLLMVLLGIVAAVMGTALSNDFSQPIVDRETGEEVQISRWAIYGLLIVFGWLQYQLFSFLLGHVGRFAGGKGSQEDARSAVAWWALVTAPIQLLPALLGAIAPPLGSVAFVVAVIAGLWMLAAAAAETHGFRSTFSTLGGVMVVSFVVAFALSIFSLIFGGLVPQ